MINSIIDGHQYVTVAVALDERSLPLAFIAADLCRRTGKKLNLLHVVEPWAKAAGPLAAGSPLFHVAEAVETRATELAGWHLDELAGAVGGGVLIRKTVVVGKPAERIGKEAANAGSCLLVIGTGGRPRRLLPRGFSTALSLMVTSPVPVMSIDTTATQRLPEHALTVLLADDLSPQSEAAVSFAFDLSAAFGKATLHHLHINGLTPEGLRAGLDTAAAAARTALDPKKAAGEVFDALLVQYKDELAARASAYRDYLEESGGVYVPDVRTGPVKAELAAAVAATEPDVLIFGRHQSVHTKPFFFGRLPYGAMLAFERPVIVVPTT